MLMLAGDLRRHANGFDGVSCGKDFEKRNKAGEMLLEFVRAHKLAVMIRASKR